MNDRILHLLPLHHVHGIVNVDNILTNTSLKLHLSHLSQVLLCALWSGAQCDFVAFKKGKRS